MRTYLYQCWDKQRQLLFTAIADDVDARTAVHRATDFWWVDVDQVTKIAFETRLEAEWAEWAVITMGHPVYNRLILPPQMPAPAYVEPNGQEPGAVDRDRLGSRYSEHILAVTAVYPRWWATGIPSVRKAKEAIMRARASRGETFNSMSMTERVLDEMRLIAEVPNPEEIIDRLRRPGLCPSGN